MTTKYVDQLTVACDLHWASVHEPNPKSHKYQVDLCNLSGPAIARLSANGVDIKDKGDDRGKFVTCKSQYMIPCVDTNGGVVQDPLGNGTKADVAIGVSEPSTNSFGTFVYLTPVKVKVKELVAFTPGEVDDEAFGEAL